MQTIEVFEDRERFLKSFMTMSLLFFAVSILYLFFYLFIFDYFPISRNGFI